MEGVKKLKIEVSPLVLLLLILSLGLGQWQTALGYILSVSVHEPTHFFIARRLGYRCEVLKLSVSGAVLYGDFDALPPKDELIIALSAPLVNLFCALVFVAMWWIFPETYLYTEVLMKANLYFGAVNLLPFYPLDGGRALAGLLSYFHSYKKCLKITRVFGFIASGILTFAFIAAAFNGRMNITVAFFAVYAAVCSLNMTKSRVYTKLMFSEVAAWRLRRGLSVKVLALSEGVTLFEAYKKCNRTQLYVIEVYGKNPPYIYLGKLSIMDIETKLLLLPQDTPLGKLLEDNKRKRS